ncbi:Protein kinase C eta type [Fukomys damarensis]|uniref:Protein kinase C eta type n=1 Tax=Fukomys damarensis TaxID=885580 RepID=A0A091CWD2_FUKDA|nr:Protein kinase C eta type [Fukomys damarensis]
MKFNGYLRVRIGEAVGLQPTRWSLRHSLFKKGHQLLDPYLTVSVDQVRVGQTSTKQKTNKPTYNEEFCANVTDGGHLELAVFHETPLGYDHFVANCTLQFQELLRTAGTSDTFEGWLSGVRFPLAPQQRGEFPPDFGPLPGGRCPGDRTVSDSLVAFEYESVASDLTLSFGFLTCDVRGLDCLSIMVSSRVRGLWFW